MMGMFMLHGPCLVDEGGNTTIFNPHSWNEEFNVLFLDQPAGVGFSYVDDSENNDAYPRRTEESAHEFLSTVNLIYEALPHLKNSSLFLTGESYGGRYVPLYSSAILDWNANVENERKIPLASIMMGDGWTSPQDQYPTFYDVGCFEVDGIPPVFNESMCASLIPTVGRCERLLDACIAFPDEIICKAASDFCFDELLMPIEIDETNVYDRTVKCLNDEPCYPQQEYIETLLSKKKVQKELEIEKQTTGKGGKFNITSDLIQDRYVAAGDFATSSVPQLEKIINDPSVEVMIYVGKNDWIVTALGTGRMLERMRFQGYVEFRAQTKIALPWKTKAGGPAGTVKKIDGLWFVELNGAGHLVKLNQRSCNLQLN
jgi:cathepsin A (carboxypeptidase C)